LIINSVYPLDNSTNVSRTVRIEVRFSESVDLDTISESNIALHGLSTTINLDFVMGWQDEDRLLTIQPTLALLENTEYVFKVMKTDVLTETTITGAVSETELEEDLYVAFKTSSSITDSTGPIGSEDPMYSDLVVDNILSKMRLLGAFPMSCVLFGESHTISLEYSKEIDTYDIEVYQRNLINDEQEDFDHSIESDENIISISVSELEHNCYVSISINSVTATDGTTTAEPEFIDYFTYMRPSTISINTIHQKLGNLKGKVKQRDVYLAAIDAMLRLEAIKNSPVVDEPNSSLSYIENCYLKDRTMLTILEMIYIERDYRAGDAVMVGNNSIQYGSYKSYILDFYAKAVQKEEEQIINLASDAMAVGVRGKFVPKTFSRDWRTLT